ncbi:sensor histidine kinase [Calothrix sp. 336/3]|uniref:sensor histidine kinase n=1 Tax=Calothrix sp. 336/3 TaxID=1337936 RepID=UPI0004E382A7|nr:HAMP domain-containing sensor histidine kinase [Calothrix sp. 336/3]AKG20710.1 histidine kinase [Calothrix sp. 336/3]
MYQWILPSLSEIIAASQTSGTFCPPQKAQQQWRIAVAATEQLLINTVETAVDDTPRGLVLAAPAPVLSNATLLQNLQSVTFTAKPFNPLALMPFQMSTAEIAIASEDTHESVLPLIDSDPLAREQFCLVFTEKFSLVLVLAASPNGEKEFRFSFEPEVVQQVWRAIAARIILTNPDLFAELEALVQQYTPLAPDYRILMEFSQLLLAELPTDKEAKIIGTEEISSPLPSSTPTPYRADIELLQAFAHEVRTPLTTIRTITRLLLKQQDLAHKVTKRLEIIDRECTEQIDRMELLFRAAELETSNTSKSTAAPLTAMCLEQILQASIPRWQDAARRRNLTLDVVLPQQLPTVVSNPTMLDRVLTGLMENFTRSLPSGSHIQVQVIPAGDQLKLQLLPQSQGEEQEESVKHPCQPPIRKALGQLLVFQPETGTISLNLNATKHLFQAIGGKLIVRQRPQQGEVLTIFLPLEVSEKQCS